jgi:hypothetical protein
MLIAALVGVAVVGLVIVAGVGYLVFGGHSHSLSGSGAGSGAESGATPSAGVDTSSQSYRMGLKSGTKGQAEINAFGGFDIGSHRNFGPQPYEQVCKADFDLESGAAPDLNLVEQDYVAGCLYGLNHQSAQWTQQRSAPNR